MSQPIIKLEVGFNNVAKIQNGNDAAYGYLREADGSAKANTNVTIAAPRQLGLTQLDPDKRYILTIEEAPAK